MRVAFVASEVADGPEAGATRRARRVAEDLATRGHPVTVLCSQWWEGADMVHERADVTYRALTTGPTGPAFAAKLPLAVARFGPDVVHVADGRPLHVAGAKAGALATRSPLVHEWYGDRSVDVDDRWTRHALGLADVVVAPSRMVKTRLRERGREGDAVRVVPDGIDFSAVREMDADESGPDIVYSRRLDEGANLETVLLALAELRDRGWSAAVVGDGPERGTYEQQARDLRIDDRVEFVGSLSLAERAATFKGAHVFAQTARKEAFASELLLALACGCVGIVEYQARSAAHELIEGLDRGFRVTSPREMADAIEDAGDLEERSVDETFTRFDHRQVLERYLQCYRDLQADYGLL